MPVTHDLLLLRNSLIVAALLLAIGVVGLTSRKGAVFTGVSLGVMLQGILLSFAAFDRFRNEQTGEAFGLIALVAVIAAMSLLFATRRMCSARSESPAIPVEREASHE